MNGEFPPAGLPDARTIHLWWVDLDGELDGEADDAANGLLSAEERERADRFRFARDASRFRICRAMLRLGLGWYLGLSPREIELRVGPFGKPYLGTDLGLFFNVAHCDGLGVLAFSTLGEVGVDVEAEHRSVEAMDIASAFFTAKEAALIEKFGLVGCHRGAGQRGVFGGCVAVAGDEFGFKDSVCRGDCSGAGRMVRRGLAFGMGGYRGAVFGRSVALGLLVCARPVQPNGYRFLMRKGLG
jgi:hypothetical protein